LVDSCTTRDTTLAVSGTERVLYGTTPRFNAEIQLAGDGHKEAEEITMRKITAGLFMSLDGVIESPQEWHFPYWSDEMGEVVGGQMAAADTMLLGRVTYEGFAAYWPTSTDDPQMAARMNSTPKLVASRTLDTVEWQNSTLIKGDVVEELKKIKQQPGKNLGMTGSVNLLRSLLRAGIVDELVILVHPIVVGKGQRLFEDTGEPVPLKLTDSKTFSNGVVALTYGPAES
jgi:dihydrofolate reductase